MRLLFLLKINIKRIIYFIYLAVLKNILDTVFPCLIINMLFFPSYLRHCNWMLPHPGIHCWAEEE